MAGDGIIFAMGRCAQAGCHTVFSFDPETVPSVVVDAQTRRVLQRDEPLPADPEATMQLPICDDCADALEAEAKDLGIGPLWPHRKTAGRQ